MAEQNLEQSIFLHAIGLASPADRAAYLDQACRNSPELRAEVDALLAAHDRLGGAAPPSAPPEPTQAVSTPPGEAAGVVIGPYRLLEQIGEGGMGTVWMAEQREPIHRLVALKVIKAGMDSKQVLARFEAERQALALMDHPNIARVLDAGATDAGRPYFVMELVKGAPITEYCDDEHLSVRERLELFGDVCAAVQHAHQKGIIHRDLKPRNILIAPFDGQPVVKVIDFGVAKATGQRLTDATLFTGFGAVVGTPEYMSPEQAETNNQDIDTRSDIFSLGVLLYELLTGSTPLTRKRVQEAALLEVLRVIREEEPPKPSTRLSGTEELPSISSHRRTEPAKLTRVVRGELDWIVMKALEKDRNRRYGTASALALDVQRYLADQPVQACPPSAAYRLRKFTRRYKVPVLVVGALVFSLVVGFVGTSVGLLEARRQRDVAEARESEARAMLQFFETRIIAAARPAGQAGGLGWDVTLRRALEAALPFVSQTFSREPLTEARVRRTLAVSFGNLGEAQLAAEQAQLAWTIYRERLGPDHPDTLATASGLALTHAALGRKEEALQLQEETLRLMKSKLGPTHTNTLGAMNNLAVSYSSVGRHKEALELHVQTLAVREAALGPNHRDTLNCMNNLALAYNALGRHGDALKIAEEMVPLMKANLGAGDRHTLGGMDTLALIYRSLGRHEESLRFYEAALTGMKVTMGPDHPMTLATMRDMAPVYHQLGRYEEELKLREATLALRKTRSGKSHPDSIATMDGLARLLATCPDFTLRDASHAVRLAREAIELAPRLGHLWNTLGIALYREGDNQAAIDALEQSNSLRMGGDSLDWFFLAMAHWRLGERDQARGWYDRAVIWMGQNASANAELRRIRTEAEELIRPDDM